MVDFTKRNTYYYDLPEELIAQTPLQKRDSSRLLCFDIDEQKIEHKIFSDVVDFFRAGDVLVLNNTRVIPCRLLGKKADTGANVEVFLIKRDNLTDWQCLAKPGKRLKEGTMVKFNDELSCTILGDNDFGGKNVRFSFDGVFEDILGRTGVMPLPPYIKEKLENGERYQTVLLERKVIRRT